jgi:hypothetical protein
MELYIFKPTGETRCPKTNEWFGDMDGQFVLARSNFTYPNPIYERITIKVPENATGLSYHFRNANMMIQENYGVIELSKPKVKRWQWWDGIDGIKIITERYFTEEEIQNHQRIGSYWRKVEGSEVEE